MIAYFDTSALVPLIIAEPTSRSCSDLWNGAERVVSARLTYVEGAAALARAERLGRLTAGQHRAALLEFDRLWSGIDVVELDEGLATTAAGLARSQGLRGYDAVHCAAAMVSSSDELVAVSGDAELLAAWSRLGLAVAEVTESPR